MPQTSAGVLPRRRRAAAIDSSVPYQVVLLLSEQQAAGLRATVLQASEHQGKRVSLAEVLRLQLAAGETAARRTLLAAKVRAPKIPPATPVRMRRMPKVGVIAAKIEPPLALGSVSPAVKAATRAGVARRTGRKAAA